jgi:hypothetical protein
MGLLVQEINELRKMLKDFDGGSLSREDLSVKIGIYAQTEKRARLILTAAALSLKAGQKAFPKRISKDLVGMDEIDDTPPVYDRTIDRGKST